MIGYFFGGKTSLCDMYQRKNGDKAQREQRTEKHAKNRFVADKR